MKADEWNVVIADPIGGLRSPTGVLVSVYVNRPSPGAAATTLRSIMKPLAESLGDYERPDEKSLRADIARVIELASRVEAEPAPAYAVFASDADDLFVFKTLTHTVTEAVMVGPRPYLRPLRAAPKPLRAGIIVADRAMARVFVSSGAMLEELGEALRADPKKANYGGFSGYSEHVARRHADEESQRIWREASARLLEAHLERTLDYLAIGGKEETVDAVGRMLHPYLSKRYRASFVSSPQAADKTSLRKEILGIDEDVRLRRQGALAGRVCDTAWSGGSAVIGLASVLNACNTHSVDALVVAGEFTRPGVLCDECGYLDRVGDVCPLCSAEMFEIDDVVGAAMEAVVASGGSVQQLRVASPLDVDGVGALTRFTSDPG